MLPGATSQSVHLPIFRHATAMQGNAPHNGFVLVGPGPPCFGWWIRRFAPEFTFAICPGRLVCRGAVTSLALRALNTPGTGIRLRSMRLARMFETGIGQTGHDAGMPDVMTLTHVSAGR